MPTKSGKRRRRTHNSLPARPPRKQVAKRNAGAPKKTPLEKLEETLAEGGTVEVNLSEDSDNLDANAVHEDVSDDEVSLLKTYFASLARLAKSCL